MFSEYTNHFKSKSQAAGALRIIYSVFVAMKGDFVLMPNNDKSKDADPDLTVSFGEDKLMRRESKSRSKGGRSG